MRDAECDWDISVPDDPDEWDPMVEELVGTIREWEALFLTENPSAVLPSQVKETHHGEEDDGEEGRGQANHHHRR